MRNTEFEHLIAHCQSASGYPAWNLVEKAATPHIYMRIPPGQGSGTQPGSEKYDLQAANAILQKAKRETPLPVRADIECDTLPVDGKLEGRMFVRSHDMYLVERAVAHLTGPMKPALQHAVHTLVMNAKPRTCTFNLASMHKILSRQDASIADTIRRHRLDEKIVNTLRQKFTAVSPHRLEEIIERRRLAHAVYSVLAPYLEKHDEGTVSDMLADPTTPHVIRTTIRRSLPALTPPENRY